MITLVALVFLIPALVIAFWVQLRQAPDPTRDWEGIAAVRGRCFGPHLRLAIVVGGASAAIAIVALLVAALDSASGRAPETPLLVAAAGLLLGVTGFLRPFMDRFAVRQAARARELTARDPEYARAVAAPKKARSWPWLTVLAIGAFLAIKLESAWHGLPSFVPSGPLWTAVVVLGCVAFVALLYRVALALSLSARAAPEVVGEPAPPQTGAAEEFRLEDVVSAPAFLIATSPALLEARLGIRLEEVWDGAEFVGFASVDREGIGRIALVHHGGADDSRVEVHLEFGSDATPERLAAALGLSAEELQPASGKY